MADDVRPADDFFGYVNAKWIAENPIPPDESRWGSFSVLRVDAEHKLKEILEEISRHDDGDLPSEAKKVRDFYRTGMDEDRLEKEGDAPLAPLLADIAAVESIGGISGLLGRLHRAGIGALWASGVDQDVKRSEVMALYISQGGLGLPDRDYYVNSDEKSVAIREGYLRFAEGMIAAAPSMGGASVAPVPATSIAIETRLAAVSMTRVELRDIEKQYNKMTPEELAAIVPSVDWDAYWAAAGMARPTYAIVCQPEFMKEVERIMKEVPLGDLKQYLRWRVLDDLANFLNEDFSRRMFEFYGRTFAGAREMKPRWRRVLGTVNGMMDEALGKLYVERHFSGDAKRKIADLVDHLTAAYRGRIERLDWMGEETKAKALAKLATVTKKLGYPDAWKDYGPLEIGIDSYAENYMRAHAFEFDRQTRKIGGPVDRAEWHMPPQMVNAYYNPPMNEIVFPAAILQPPFFDPDADLGANYGGIGTVIGHELTHGFDDQGALFDLNGNLANWWTAEDKTHFNAKTAKLAAQYDAYEPLPGLHVNGKLTLGENIADLGGIVIAYDALRLALKDVSAPSAGAAAEREGAGSVPADGPNGGFDPYQRFFINYAITERGAIREESLRLQIQTDPHSPSPYRVNGPLSDMEEFYEAFGVKEGDALWRPDGDRVRIW